MQIFYMGDHEAELEDPLILAGGRVVPAVIQAVVNPEMRLRRYAIGFLGDARVQEAIPTLQRIVTTNNEQDYFRGDALEALFKIAPALAREMASDIDRSSIVGGTPRPDTDYLGWSAREVLKGSSRLKERRTVRNILYELWFPEALD